MGMKSAEGPTGDELLALETGALDPAMFPHPEHVRLAYEMLGRHPFGEAVTRFSHGLRLLAGQMFIMKPLRSRFWRSSVNAAPAQDTLIGTNLKQTTATFWRNAAWNDGMTRIICALIWPARRSACRDLELPILPDG
jgi:hypothetical protein